MIAAGSTTEETMRAMVERGSGDGGVACGLTTGRKRGVWRRGRRRVMGSPLWLAGAVVFGALAGPGPLTGQGAAGASPRVLTLTEAVERALDDNQQLEGARQMLEQAQAQAREAWGNVMPRADFSMNYTRNLLKPQFFLPARFMDPDAPEGEVVAVETGSDNSWFAQARVDQPVFNGQAFIGVGAAARFEELQQEVLRGRRQQVVTSTRLDFYNVLLAEEQLRLTTQSVARVAQVLDETRKLNRAGLASEYEVLRLEVELANLEPNARRSSDALDAARRSLAVAMGVASLDGVEMAGSLLTIDLPELTEVVPVAAAVDVGGDGVNLLLGASVEAEALPPEQLLELALARRSDLRQLRLTRDLRATERKAEMSNYLPRVSLFGTWTKQAQHDGAFEFFGGNSFETGAVGVQVDIPIFSGFQRPARLSRLGAVVDQVEADLAYALEQASNETLTLQDQAREAYQRAAAQERAVAQATRGYQIARQEYGAGLVSQLQVTDAELALRQSEFNYAQSVYDYLTAQARLDAAIGVVPLVDTGDELALEYNAGRP